MWGINNKIEEIRKKMKNLDDKLNILVLSPSKRHTCPASVLYGISKSNINSNVYILDSDRDKDSVYKNPKTNQMIKDSISAPVEPIFEDPNKYQYIEKLDEAIEKFDIDYIIPTSERGVKIISNLDKYASFKFIADKEIINLFQDKFQTYKFINEHIDPNLMRVPNNISTINHSTEEIYEFMKKEGEVFVKPAHAKSGGGVDMGFAKNIDELYRNFPDFKSKEYVISEKLYLPELSHTFVVKNGDISIQSSAKSLDKIGFAPSKKLKTIKSEQLNEFSIELFNKIKQEFPTSFIDGPYNQDILFDKEGKMVLSEVNPGRLPGGIELTINAGLNYSDILMRSFMNQSIGDLNYTKGLEQQIF